MPNFYCVPESCARVVWREYLPPAIRYRYSGEDWITIEGADDYSTEQEWTGGQNPNIRYRIAYSNVNVRRRGRFFGYYGYYLTQTIDAIPPFSDPEIRIMGQTVNGFEHWARDGYSSGNPHIDSTNRIYTYHVRDATGEMKHVFTHYPAYGTRFNGFVPADGSVEENPGGGDCTFTVYKNEQIVHEETRAECPEVEKLDARLSDEYKEIEIEKLPYLERIEVVDYAYVKFGANLFRGNIPDECLNIYRNNVTAPVPLPGGVPVPTIQSQASFILEKQICSLPNLPPPEYTVICDCDLDCESCPPDTCAVECGDHICCYGSDGIAVKEIAISDYCGNSFNGEPSDFGGGTSGGGGAGNTF